MSDTPPVATIKGAANMTTRKDRAQAGVTAIKCLNWSLRLQGCWCFSATTAKIILPVSAWCIWLVSLLYYSFISVKRTYPLCQLSADNPHLAKKDHRNQRKRKTWEWNDGISLKFLCCPRHHRRPCIYVWSFAIHHPALCSLYWPSSHVNVQLNIHSNQLNR